MSGLWGGIKIPVLGVTGEHFAGKTLFVSSIDPRNTKIYDFEYSGASYEGLGVKERVDVPKELLKIKNGEFSPIEKFLWFEKELLAIKPGEFTVVAADPINDVEQGLADWVESHPERFGRTKTQYEKMSGIMWGDVDAYWSHLLSILASKVETFAFTTHMGDVWSGGTNTKRRKAKGKPALYKLASLYLLLERKADAKGNYPEEPAAITIPPIGKSRLAHTKLDVNGNPVIKPILPPRIPVATPNAIRKYITAPSDWSKLKKGETVEPTVYTEEEKLETEREISENNRKAAEAKLSQLELAANAAAKQAAMRKSQAPAAAAAPEGVTVGTEAAASEPLKGDPLATEETPVTDASPKAAVEHPVSTETDVFDTILRQKASLAMTDEQFHKALAKRGVITPHLYPLAEAVRKLSLEDAENLRKALWDLLTKRDLMQDTGKSAAAGKA